MTDPVLAAVITSAGAIVASVIGIMRERGKRRTAEEDKKKTESAALLTLSTGEMPGAPYSLERKSTVITFDETGSGSRRDRYTGVRVTHPVTNLLIPIDNWIDCPGSKLKAPVVRSDDAALGVRLDGVNHTDGRVRGHVELTGYHSPDSTPVSFEIEVPFEHSFCMTREEVELAYSASEWKTEYASSHAVAPTRTLDVEVRFPESHRSIARPQVVAFFQRGETVVDSETERLKRNLEFHNGTARLAVPAPNSRVRYAIAWMPPSGKQRARTEGASANP